MKPKKRNIPLMLGIVLLVGAMGLVLFSQVQGDLASRRAQSLVTEIEALLPEKTKGIPEDRADRSMPVLQVEGMDFSGILEVPAFGVALPIYSQWDTGKLSSFPCRYFGNVYDGSLIVGGSDRKGQFDFCGRIDIGNAVVVTDMTGAQYIYTVHTVERSKKADADTLVAEGNSLTLFMKDAYAMEYIIVRCAMAGWDSGI